MPSSSSSSTPAAPTVVTATTNSMPNMARTLLLNADGSQYQDTSAYAYEYVPPYYRPVALPSELLTVRRALFGSEPDLAGMNYALWQYMRVLHSTEFDEYVYALDPRVTYLHDKSHVDQQYGVTVANGGDALDFTGTPTLGDGSGRMREMWRLVRAHPAYTIVNLRTGRQATHYPTVVDNLTSYMPLTGHTTYMVRVRLAVAGVQTSWHMSYLAAPAAEMGLVMRAAAVGNIGAAAYAYLFPSRMPFTLFKQLWEQHTQLAYKLSGLLLALVYRTQELRTGTQTAVS